MSYFTRKEERRVRQQELDHAYRMNSLNAQNKRKELQLEGDIKTSTIDAESFKETQIDNSGAAEVIRACVRPLVIAYLLVLITIITSEMHTLLGGLSILPVEKIVNLYEMIISGIIYLTMTAISWVFGSRPTQAMAMINKTTQQRKENGL